ncbi:MAG: hypothetical protein ACREL5_10710 [Gemmatimonadales bacterium]
MLGFLSCGVIAMAACAPDPPTADNIAGPKANLYSNEYECELGTPGYEDYCDDFGSLGTGGTPDAGWCSSTIVQTAYGATPMSNDECDILQSNVAMMEEYGGFACVNAASGLQTALNSGKMGWLNLYPYDVNATSETVQSGPAKYDIYFDPTYDGTYEYNWFASAIHEGSNEDQLVNDGTINDDQSYATEADCYSSVAGYLGIAPRIVPPGSHTHGRMLRVALPKEGT